MQSVSAIIFAVLIHIPLARIHSLMIFLTGMLPLMLNMRSKIWFYEKANSLVAMIWLRIYKDDYEVVNIIKKNKEMKYPNQVQEINLDSGKGGDTDMMFKLSKNEEETLEWSIYTTVVWLALFFGIGFNYFYEMFM